TLAVADSQQSPATTSPLLSPKVTVFYQRNNSQDEKLADVMLTQLQQKLPALQAELAETSNMSRNQLEQFLGSEHGCSITVGSIATQKVLSARSKKSIFAIKVPRHKLDQLKRIYQRLGIFVTGLYEEQPFARQVLLAESLSSDLEVISILLGQSDKYYLADYQRIAQQYEMELAFQLLRPTDPPEKYLKNVAESGGWLALTNNDELFQSSKLAGLVLAAYYQKVNLLGNKLEDSKSGALASIYTSINSLANEAIPDIRALCVTNTRRPPRYAKNFSVEINQHIADNTNVRNLDAGKITKQIQEIESQNKLK
ncbi:MAG: hypothetical protein OQJ89_15880, partial [Kangiellaceae bacterium]|nr:hypothetical protein [Kangiellaceae bacterium]